MFSALDSVLERISDLQQLVSSWAEDLSEDELPQDSPVPSPSSLSHIDLDVHQPNQKEAEQTGISGNRQETDTKSRSGTNVLCGLRLELKLQQNPTKTSP